MNRNFSEPNVKGQIPAESGLSAPTCSRFVYSVESSDGKVIDEVKINMESVPARYMVKYVHNILQQLGRAGYFNDALKFSAREEPRGASFSDILIKRMESLDPSIPDSVLYTKTPSSDKKEENSLKSDSGHKNMGSETSSSENLTSLENGSEKSISQSNLSGLDGGSESISNNLLNENVKVEPRGLPRWLSRLVRSLLFERAHSEKYPTSFLGVQDGIAEFKIQVPVTDEEKRALRGNNYELMKRPIIVNQKGDQLQKE